MGRPPIGRPTTTWVPRNALDFDDEITTDSLMAVMQNYFFDRRFVTTIGIRDRNRSILPNDETPPPAKGEGYDNGIAFSLLENRISGSIKRYETNSVGERTQAGERSPLDRVHVAHGFLSTGIEGGVGSRGMQRENT